MDISVVIVNYNVKHFLEQVIGSVQKASQNLAVEILVVDNNSVDGSNEMMDAKFPDIQLIKNKKNVGFSKANNQAIKVAKGKYILLLNPDTIIEEDTLDKTFAFMESKPDAGACGVKMIDGAGNYHRESKRALPTPQVSFYKMIGLSKLFPKSSKFGKYYMTHLSDDQINEIEVLAGCFMFIAKKALDKVGLLDEDFFMYGEDIDLSYRIIKGGFKNYYYPHTRIIHYKGESTKKKNFNYVKIFYTAMIIFFDKHFTSKKDKIFANIIKFAIYARASVALISTWLNTLKTPFTDAVLIYAGMYAITDYWEKNHRYIEGGTYPEEYLGVFVPAYILIWITSMYFGGGYDKPLKFSKIIKGIIWGTISISVTYSFLEESFRFSRALIVLGAVWATFIVISTRILTNLIRYKSIHFLQDKTKRIIIVGSQFEVLRIRDLVQKLNLPVNLIGYVSDDTLEEKDLLCLGKTRQLDECVSLYQIDEIIFCAKDLSSQEIMNWITKIGPKIEYKIVPEDSWSIIGSHSSNRAGELYTIDIKMAIDTPENKRSKRFFDIGSCLLILLLSPFIIWKQKKPLNMCKNILKVLTGLKTWVAYPMDTENNLPKLKKGVIQPYKSNQKLQTQQINRLYFLYAKDYTIWADFELLISNLKYLGN